MSWERCTLLNANCSRGQKVPGGERRSKRRTGILCSEKSLSIDDAFALFNLTDLQETVKIGGPAVL